MTSSGSVVGDERLRLFLGFRLPAPIARRMPISRVRSITLIVIALTSPTRLMATISSPSTVTDVVSPAFAAMASLAGSAWNVVRIRASPVAAASSASQVKLSCVR